MSLRAYPATFRNQVGDAMRQAFSERCLAAAQRSTPRLFSVWARGILDSLYNGSAERFGTGNDMRSQRPDFNRSPRRDLMASVFDDVKRAARRLQHAPLFTASVVLTLAIGVGAFISIFSILDNVLWESMPYKDPGRLAYVWRNYSWADFPRGWAGGVDVIGNAHAGRRHRGGRHGARRLGEPVDARRRRTRGNSGHSHVGKLLRPAGRSAGDGARICTG